MCNCYRSTVRLEVVKEAFDALRLPLVFPNGAPNLQPLDNIRPTDRAPIIRPLDPTDPSAGVEIVQARWDLIPWFWKQPIKAKKFLATNARSETVHTTAAFKEAFKRRRCLIPTDGFYEWTGEKKGGRRPNGASRGRVRRCSVSPVFGTEPTPPTASSKVSPC